MTENKKFNLKAYITSFLGLEPKWNETYKRYEVSFKNVITVDFKQFKEFKVYTNKTTKEPFVFLDPKTDGKQPLMLNPKDFVTIEGRYDRYIVLKLNAYNLKKLNENHIEFRTYEQQPTYTSFDGKVVPVTYDFLRTGYQSMWLWDKKIYTITYYYHDDTPGCKDNGSNVVFEGSLEECENYWKEHNLFTHKNDTNGNYEGNYISIILMCK